MVARFPNRRDVLTAHPFIRGPRPGLSCTFGDELVLNVIQSYLFVLISRFSGVFLCSKDEISLRWFRKSLIPIL